MHQYWVGKFFWIKSDLEQQQAQQINRGSYRRAPVYGLIDWEPHEKTNWDKEVVRDFARIGLDDAFTNDWPDEPSLNAQQHFYDG